jgi:hypothetical protein
LAQLDIGQKVFSVVWLSKQPLFSGAVRPCLVLGVLAPQWVAGIGLVYIQQLFEMSDLSMRVVEATKLIHGPGALLLLYPTQNAMEPFYL